MSVMLKRPGSEEGLEMPVKEVITRMMLCVMFGLDDKEDIHIYNSTGEKVAFLFCLDSSFAPQTAGDYVIMLDSEVKQTADDKQKTGGSKSASSLESSTSIHSDEYPVLNTQPGCSKDMQERVERQFALLKRPGCEEGIELELSMPISKGMICELFGLGEGEKLLILTRLRFSDTLSEECSLRSKDELFSPRSASIFTVMTECEFMRAQERKDLSSKAKPKSKLRTMNRPLLTPTVFSQLPSNLFHRIMKTMSYDAFIRLAMTCREMMSILQMKGITKASPLTLTVTLNELPNDDDEQAVLLLARKHHPNYFCAEILPYYLSDLRPFVLEGIRVKGDATAFVPKECLPSACHEIQRHKVAFKTLFSVYNRLPIAVELLEILKPKRAEISLASHGKGDYGEGFTGRQWPFVNVGEELKLITSSFDYIEDMNKYRGIFHFISQLKIFQAFCLCRLSFSVTELIFREFLADPEMGNIQMIQFLYPEILNRNADIFGGIPRFFEGEYRQKTTDANRTEVRPRIRAGIISNNGEKAAIVESRKYLNFRVVTMAFTPYDGYLWQLQRIYGEFDELHKTIDDMFMK